MDDTIRAIFLLDGTQRGLGQIRSIQGKCFLYGHLDHGFFLGLCEELLLDLLSMLLGGQAVFPIATLGKLFVSSGYFRQLVLRSKTAGARGFFTPTPILTPFAAQGHVRVGDMRAASGRMSFALSALGHLQPFLGPI